MFCIQYNMKEMICRVIMDDQALAIGFHCFNIQTKITFMCKTCYAFLVLLTEWLSVHVHEYVTSITFFFDLDQIKAKIGTITDKNTIRIVHQIDAKKI